MNVAGWLLLSLFLTPGPHDDPAISWSAQPNGQSLVWAAPVPHEGPDPVGHWLLEERFCPGDMLRARLGPDGQFLLPPKWDRAGAIRAAVFEDRTSECRINTTGSLRQQFLAGQPFTVVAVVALDPGSENGCLVRARSGEAGEAAGWVLGFDEGVFTFRLAAAEDTASGHGAPDPVALTGRSHWQPGHWHHVVGVFDGETAELFVDGQLEASTPVKGRPVVGSDGTLLLGGSSGLDASGLQGRMREVALYDRAARGRWVQAEALRQSRVSLTSVPRAARENRFTVEPFLQFGTLDGMTVIWQLEQAGPATLHWGETDACDQRIESADPKTIHQIRITGLAAEAQYFYRVTAGAAGAEGAEAILSSEVRTFQTACRPGTPIAFAVIGDTQERPQIAKPVAELAWTQRPHFLLLAGDLVDNGEENSDWTEQFFPSLSPLISRVPLFPVLGNHEQNARNYFDYMALPDPEYYYQFSYGDADFFMIDSNRNVDPGSEQYRWLDQALGESRAIWKFVCHHHPPYSSDENDYGDLWKTNQSTRGDLRIRQLVPLYEKHHVDIVWTGHIHSYERTWPIRDNAAVEQGGTIYVVTGGGGGTLETPAPSRPFFQNNVRHGHHYCMVALHRGVLELKAFTIDDRLFDSLRIEKPR